MSIESEGATLEFHYIVSYQKNIRIKTDKPKLEPLKPITENKYVENLFLPNNENTKSGHPFSSTSSLLSTLHSLGTTLHIVIFIVCLLSCLLLPSHFLLNVHIMQGCFFTLIQFHIGELD